MHCTLFLRLFAIINKHSLFVYNFLLFQLAINEDE